MRYAYYVHKDYWGIPAGDKEAVMEQLYHGPKTTKEMASTIGHDPIYVRKIVSNLVNIGAVRQVGRQNGAKLWGVKA